MPRHLAVAASLLVIVGVVGAVGLTRPRPAEPVAGPAQPVAAVPEPPAESGVARWTRLPTPVTGEAGYRRLPPVERPADVNPAPPQAARPPAAPILQPEPEPEAAPEEPRSLAELCRLPGADRVQCRAHREREARAAERRARERAAIAERQRAAETRARQEPASSAALGVSPHYDLMR